MTATKKGEPDADEMFTFECHDGITIELPSLANIDPDLDVLDEVGDSLESTNPLVAMRANRRFLVASVPEGGEQILRIKRASEFTELLKAWAEFSGVTPGELRASSGS